MLTTQKTSHGKYMNMTNETALMGTVNNSLSEELHEYFYD